MSFTDKVQNKAQEAVGKVKEKVGDVTNNEDLKREGQADQVEANTKQAGERVKDTAKDVKDAFKKD